jgi:hypothetical protein
MPAAAGDFRTWSSFFKTPWAMLVHRRDGPSFRGVKMAHVDQQNQSLAAKVAWPLLVLTAALQVYMGLSAVAYVFMGLKPASGLGGWTAATMGGLQAVAAVVAFWLAVRRDLRRATLAIAGSVMLGCLSTLPSVVERGFDFDSGDALDLAYFVASPVIAIAAAVLAWRNAYPIAAALMVSAMTLVGILVAIAFAIVIAIYGF